MANMWDFDLKGLSDSNTKGQFAATYEGIPGYLS